MLKIAVNLPDQLDQRINALAVTRNISKQKFMKELLSKGINKMFTELKQKKK